MSFTTWNSAVAAAKAGTGRAKILVVGDSIAEGENASSRATRWLDSLVAKMRSDFGLTAAGGQGLTPAGGYATYLDSSEPWRNPWTVTGTVSTGQVGTMQGDKGAYLNSGASISRTVTGDSADLVYFGVSTGLSGITWGTITIAVDGTTVATVSPTAAGAQKPGQIYHFSLGTAGTHTVKYTATGGAVMIDGDVIYNGDYTAGITYWDASHTGYTSSQDITMMGTSGATSGSTTGNWAGWSNFAPHLVIIDQVGGNDLGDGTNTPSQVASNLTSMLNALKALPSSPSILVFAPMRTPGVESESNGSYTIADYVSACKTVATGAGTSVNWLDLNDVYPYASIPSSWTTGDSQQQHPNDTGQAAEMSTIAGIIEPAPTSTTGTASVTAGSPTVSATGSETDSGSAAATLGKPAVAATGSETDSGSAAATAPAPTVSASGSAGSTDAGSGSIAAPAPTAHATGTETDTGSASVTSGKPTVAATGSAAGVDAGTVAVTGGAPHVAATGSETNSGSAAITAARPVVAASTPAGAVAPVVNPSGKGIWTIYPLAKGTRARAYDPVSMYTSLTVVERHNVSGDSGMNAGTWQITGPNEALADLLVPGNAVLLIRDGIRIMSGPVTSIQRGYATSTISGVDDLECLNDRILFPAPTQPITNQPQAYDNRSGTAETVLLGYVNADAGPGALTARKWAGLRVPTSLGRGSSVSISGRLEPVGTTVSDIAEMGGLHVSILQNEDASGPFLDLEVRQVNDLSANIRFGSKADFAGVVLGTDWSYTLTRPTVTDAIVAGGGQGVNRIFVEQVDSTAESLWGAKIESLVDQRQTTDNTQLTQAGASAISDGANPVSVTFTITDTDDIRYRRDWNVGDTVGVFIDGLNLTAPVREVTTTVQVQSDQMTETVSAVVGARDSSNYVTATNAAVAKALQQLQLLRAS